MAKGKQKNKEAETKPPRAFSSHTFLKVASIGMASLAGFCVVVFGVLLYLNFAYANEIFPGVRIGLLSFSGKTPEQAQQLLEGRIAALDVSGIQITYKGETENIDSTIATESGVDTAFPLYLFDSSSTLNNLLAYGRGSNGLLNSWQRLRGLVSPQEFSVPLAFQDSQFLALLREQYGEDESPAVDAGLAVDEQGGFTVTKSSIGSIFLYDTYVSVVKTQLNKLQSPEVTLALTEQNPQVVEAQVATFLDDAKRVTEAAPYTITWEDKSWQLAPEDVAKSLSVKAKDDSYALVFASGGLESFLSDIKEAVDIQAQDARFAISNGKVAEFQSSTVGRTVDIDALLANLDRLIEGSQETSIQLTVKEVQPGVTESEAESLGITERVAIASTNFKGSPTNRRKNIANGVRLLSGILIKPGETFSLVKALSPITTANGYLPELVIKGNRTIPEVGGGLCQIGTTMFRVTLAAGLPIVERKNHSYRVSYYEPPVGMDATIYDPSPDFKFTNDYENYLLLQGYVEGDNIYFEFWGTKDDRVSETTDPKIYNITSPGPTKYIESEDLAPGEQKCIEHAHNGASADFTYTVTYSNGEKKEETFYSKYKAWQAVCLVGKSA